MSEDREEGLIMMEEMDKPLEETGVGPTSLDVTDEQISIEYPFQSYKREKCKNRIKRWNKHKRKPELAKGNRRGE